MTSRYRLIKTILYICLMGLLVQILPPSMGGMAVAMEVPESIFPDAILPGVARPILAITSNPIASEADIGQSVLLTVDIANQGNLVARDVRLLVSGEPSFQVAGEMIGDMEPGEKVSVPLELTVVGRRVGRNDVHLSVEASNMVNPVQWVTAVQFDETALNKTGKGQGDGNGRFQTRRPAAIMIRQEQTYTPDYNTIMRFDVGRYSRNDIFQLSLHELLDKAHPELTLSYTGKRPDSARGIPFFYDAQREILFFRPVGSGTYLVSTVTNETTPEHQPAAWSLTFNEPVVSLFTGSAGYDYAIDLPPGPADFQPTLSLSYNSGAANGIAGKVQTGEVGFGWALGGTVDIAQVVKICEWNTNLVCPVNAYWGNDEHAYSGNIEFTLAIGGTGHELIHENGMAANGDPGRYYVKGDAAVYAAYCAGAGGMNLPVCLVNDDIDGDVNGQADASEQFSHGFWIVKTGDNATYRLGYTANSEQEIIHLESGSRMTHVIPALRWRLDTATDRFGNQMIYEYLEGRVKGTNGQDHGKVHAAYSYLQEIRYGYNKIRFNNVAHGNSYYGGALPEHYEAGVISWQTHHLTRIDVQTQDYLTGAGGYQTRRAYELTYTRSTYGVNGATGQLYNDAQTAWCANEMMNNWGGWQVNMLTAITYVDQNGRSRVRIDTDQDGHPDGNVPDVEFAYEFRATALWQKWFNSGGGSNGTDPYVHQTRFCYPYLETVYAANGTLTNEGNPDPAVTFIYDDEQSFLQHQFNGPSNTTTWINTVDRKLVDGGWSADAPTMAYSYAYGVPSYGGEASNNQPGSFQGFVDATRLQVTDSGDIYRQEKTTFAIYPFHHVDSSLNGRPLRHDTLNADGNVILRQESDWVILDDYTKNNDLRQPVIAESRNYDYLTGTQSRTGYTYDVYGNRTEVREFGDDMVTSMPLRTTLTEYLYNTDVFSVGDGWLINLSWQTTLFEGDGNGVVVSRQRMRYDQSETACTTTTLIQGQLTHTDVYHPGGGNDDINGECNNDWVTTRYVYGQGAADWQLTSVVAPNGVESQTRWLNDVLIAHILQVADRTTYTTTYTYNDQQTPWKVTGLIQPNGARLQNEYDSFGRLVGVYSPDAATGEPVVFTKQYIYHDNEIPLFIDEITLPGSLNEMTKRVFVDTLGRPLQELTWGISSDFDVVAADIEYDQFGRATCQTAVIDAGSSRSFNSTLRCRTVDHTLTSFDVKGESDRVVAVDGQTTTMTRNGLISTVVAPNQTWRSQSIDSLGRSQTVFEHENKPVIYEATELAHPGNLGTLSNDAWLSPEISNFRNNAGYLTYGPYHFPEYVGHGNVAQFRLAIESAAGWNVPVFRLDVFDATAQQVIADRLVYRHEFSGGLGRFTEFSLAFDTVDNANHQLEYRVYWFDTVRAAHQQTAVYWGGSAQETHYSYDMGDRLRFVTDAEGHVTEMRYDQTGQKIYMDDPDMGIWQYGYDVAGNLLWQTDAKNQRICFFYDEMGRFTEKYYAGSELGACTVPSGQLVTAKRYHESGAGLGKISDVIGFKPEGGLLYTDAYTYDYRGRIIEQNRSIDGRSYVMATTAFDDMDRPLTTIYPNGEVIEISYDAQHANSLRVGQSELVVDTTYNFRQQVQEVTLGNGLLTRYQYGNGENDYRLQSIKHGTLADSMPDFAYQYDVIGNIIQIETGDVTEAYHYDGLNRLTEMYINDNLLRQYQYDALGNIEARIDYGYDAVGIFSNLETTRFEYGASVFTYDQPHAVTKLNGQTQFSYDANGNMLTRAENGTSYDQSWDVENRLASVINSETNEKTSFYYDADGQRVVTISADDSILYTPFVDYERQNIPFPTVTLTTSKTIVPPGLEVLLQWQSTGSTHCIASGAWEGFWQKTGEKSVLFENIGTYSYELQCSNSLGQISEDTLVIEVQPLPLVNFTANGEKTLLLRNNTNFTLTWEAIQADTCVAAGDWPENGQRPLEGIEEIEGYISETRSYELICANAAGNVIQTVTVEWVEPGIELYSQGLAGEVYVENDMPFELEWQSYFVEECVATGAWSGSKPANGLVEMAGFNNSAQIFELTCVDPISNDFVSDSITVYAIKAPKVVLSTNIPWNEVFPETDFTIMWDAWLADTCVASSDLPAYFDNWSGQKPLSGEQILTSMLEPGFYVYRLSCTNKAAETETAVTIRVIDSPYCFPDCRKFLLVSGENHIYHHLGEITSLSMVDRTPPKKNTAVDTVIAPNGGHGTDVVFDPAATVIERITYRLENRVVAIKVSGDPDLFANGLFYTHSDHIGSVVARSNKSGDLVGNVIRYYPFGEPRTNEWNAQTGIGFTGHKHNDDLGLIYMNARYYVPGIGRFLSADTIVPAKEDPQGLNRYAYVRNNPLRYVDPDGYCWGRASIMRSWNINTSWGEVGFGTNCANIDQALIVAQHPDATFAQTFFANSYTAAWVVAIGSGATGTGILAVNAVIPTTAMATTSTASTSVAAASVANQLCANDGDCTNEVQALYQGARGLSQGAMADGNPVNELYQMGQLFRVPGHIVRQAHGQIVRAYDELNAVSNLDQIKELYFRFNLDYEMLVSADKAKPVYTRVLFETMSAQSRMPELAQTLGEKFPTSEVFYTLSNMFK